MRYPIAAFWAAKSSVQPVSASAIIVSTSARGHWPLFAGALKFDNAAIRAHDDIHVGFPGAVFRIVEIEHGHVLIDTDRDGGGLF